MEVANRDASLLIKVDHRLGLGLVRVQPNLHRLGLVVGALAQRLAGYIVLAVDLGGIVVVGVGAARGQVHPAIGNTINNSLVGDDKGDYGVDLEVLGEELRLGGGAGKAVQQQAAALAALAEDHVHDQLVRNQLDTDID